MNSLKVCISGDLGSGKSHLAIGLGHEYECPVLSMGAIQREMAKVYGMGTLEFNRFSESKPEIDLERDQALVIKAKENERLVVDSRMAWHFIPDSIKIHLLVHPAVAAKRIMQAHREGEKYESVDDAINQLRERKESENRRFSALYGVNCDSFANYDYVVDTTTVNPESVTKLAVSLVNSIGGTCAKLWVASKNLFPTQKINECIPTGYQGASNQSNLPILAIRHDSAFYIYDGHKRVFEGICNGMKFIPVVLIEDDSQMYQLGCSPSDFARISFSRSKAYDWEDALGFKFEYYPELR